MATDLGHARQWLQRALMPLNLKLPSMLIISRKFTNRRLISAATLALAVAVVLLPSLRKKRVEAIHEED